MQQQTFQNIQYVKYIMFSGLVVKQFTTLICGDTLLVVNLTTVYIKLLCGDTARASSSGVGDLNYTCGSYQKWHTR